MTTFHRWCLVAALALVVVALPVVARSLPVGEQDVTAADLLARIDESSYRGYSGYVESLGSLDLPVADRFTDVAALFGERTRLRVWWRSADAWRVDKLLATGETDLVHDAGGTVEWSYERDRAEFGLDPAVRLPRTADLLPPAVAERLAARRGGRRASRLPDRRVAGRVALGLRLVPGRTAVERGARRRVGRPGDRHPAAGRGVRRRRRAGVPQRVPRLQRPSAGRRRTSRSPRPTGADVDFDGVLDIADAANQFAPVVPPDGAWPACGGPVTGPARSASTAAA